MLKYFIRLKNISLLGIIWISAGSICEAKTLIDYFLPMPIIQPLKSNKWGCAATGKRDIYNGIEDTANKSFSYWDGPIIMGPDGKYHMFASRWGQNGGHWDWLSSVGIHAVSESVMGPYVDKGLTWPSNSGGKGHNLTILQLKDGTYASVVSDTRPGDFFTASSLNGPWTFAGSINVNANGFSKPSHIANLSIIIRPDNGKFMIVERGGQIMISDKLTGPYMIQGKSVYNTVNLPNLEDPVLWYSGGYYHIVVNSWSEKKAYHLRSQDGINNWTNQGLAFDPKSNFLRYTDGTVNHWCKIERPGVYIANGHITHWTFSVIDSEKEKDLGNDDHNSKVIVVPFDGAAFDGVIVSEHRDTVYNGKFNAGTSGWTLNVRTGNATGTVINNEYKTTISNAGSKSYDIQLVQDGLILKKGNSYKVSFDAYASANRTIEVNMEKKGDPSTSYLQKIPTFELTSNKAPYSFIFKMEQTTDSSARLGFNLGASAETVFLDNISIQPDDNTSSFVSAERRDDFTPIINYRKASLQILITSSASMSMEIFNLKGVTVVNSEINACPKGSLFNYNLSAIPKGIYLVVLKSNGRLIHCSRVSHDN